MPAEAEPNGISPPPQLIRAFYHFLEEVVLQPPVTVKTPTAPVQVGPAIQGLGVFAAAQASARLIHALYLFLEQMLLQPSVTVTTSTALVQVGPGV